MNRFSHRIGARSLRLLIGCMLCALYGAARADGLYQIELVVFARDGAQPDVPWRADLPLRYPEHLQVLQAEAEGDPVPFQLLPSSALQLNREAAALGQRRALRVLFHGAWQQNIADTDHAGAVFINGGRAFGNHHELEGFVSLSSERFLHINSELWLTRFAPRPVAAATATAPQLPPAPVASDSDATTNADAVQVLPEKVYVLQDQRRLRGGELLYQDHPQLGALVLVTPVADATAQQ